MKYYSIIHDKYIGKEDNKKDSLITDYYLNSKEQIVNPNSKVSPLLDDDKGNSSKSISISEANSNLQYNENLQLISIELCVLIAQIGMNTIQVSSNNGSKNLSSQFSLV